MHYFLPYVRNSHVLIRADDTTGGLHQQEWGLMLPATTQASTQTDYLERCVLSVRATHMPGVSNQGADLLSQGHPCGGEWKHNPDVAKQIWLRCGHPPMDLT